MSSGYHTSSPLWCPKKLGSIGATWGHAPPGHPKNMANFSVFFIFLGREPEFDFRSLIHSLLSLKFCVDWGGDRNYSSKTDRDTPVRILVKSTKMTPLAFVGTSSQWICLHISCARQLLRWKSFTKNFVSTGYDVTHILWRHRHLTAFLRFECITANQKLLISR